MNQPITAIASEPTPNAEDRYGEITNDEARRIAIKFINHFFNNPGREKPRASIPADPRLDDDLRLMEYLRRVVNLPGEEAKPEAAEPQAQTGREWPGQVAFRALLDACRRLTPTTPDELRAKGLMYTARTVEKILEAFPYAQCPPPPDTQEPEPRGETKMCGCGHEWRHHGKQGCGVYSFSHDAICLCRLASPAQQTDGTSAPLSTIPCVECGSGVHEFTIPNDVWNAVVRRGGPETDREYLCRACWDAQVCDFVRAKTDGTSGASAFDTPMFPKPSTPSPSSAGEGALRWGCRIEGDYFYRVLSKSGQWFLHHQWRRVGHHLVTHPFNSADEAREGLDACPTPPPDYTEPPSAPSQGQEGSKNGIVNGAGGANGTRSAADQDCVGDPVDIRGRDARGGRDTGAQVVGVTPSVEGVGEKKRGELPEGMESASIAGRNLCVANNWLLSPNGILGRAAPAFDKRDQRWLEHTDKLRGEIETLRKARTGTP